MSTILKNLLLTAIFCYSASAYAGITVDSLHTTPSTCANNGTITIFAHATAGTLLYGITSGPIVHSQQSSNQFVNLPSGIYHLLVTDASNDTARITDTVRGSYTSPNFTLSYQNPQCAGTATGLIVGTPQNAGTPPFSWVLTNTTTNQTTTQPKDSFFNLAAGSYSLRQYDSCGNFATYSITLVDPNDSFTIVNVTNRIFTCDSVSVNIQLYVISTTYARPYTIKVKTHNGTYQHVITNISYNGNYPQIYESVGGVSYGDSINITITDICGRSVYRANTVADFNITVAFTSVSDSCLIKYIGNFSVTGDSTQTNVNNTYMPDPVTVVVRNSGTNALIDSTVTNDPINHYSPTASTSSLTAGQSYKVKITDGCGHTYTHVYQWPSPPSPTTFGSVVHSSCMDSTACYQIQWQNTFYSIPTLTLLSGPTHISSTKAHYAYRDSIIYPHTFTGGHGTNYYFIQLTNLAAGTYHYHAFDSCGNSLTDSFTITPQNLNSDHFTISYIRGCPGQNVITVSDDNFSAPYLLGVPGGTINLNTPYDTIENLNAGSYILSLHYLQTTFAQPVNQHPACQLINDTLIIPPYQSPQMLSSKEIKCHGSVYVVLSPDSTTGVPPYKYEIISGPQLAGIQSSNTFILTQSGSYTARLTDSCGFAGTFTFTVDTVSFAPIVRVGSSCIGNNATLSAQYSPYATYLWHLPSGGTYIGDSLVINPITLANYGTYHISKIVSINGCRDTINQNYTLSGTGESSLAASICPGQSYVFGGIARTQAGTYFDTIPASPCDSIVTFTLTIRTPARDSVSQNICTGQSVIVGSHTYTTQGIYRDTFVTAGCDSIHILNLQVAGYKHGAKSQTICQGQIYSFGGIALNQSGIYYDTVATASCDSIITLTLMVKNPAYDSVAQSICTGQSVIVGTHTYTSSGIYRDTFTTVLCDSIHVLNLTVSGYKYGSISQTICQGQSYLFGGNTLTQAGAYYDTLATSSCDSIVTLTLTVSTPAYDSVSQSICTGQSVTVGTHTYNTPGIYRDTLATANCDSIHVLNLQVNSYLFSFISQNICLGQSYSFAGQNITQAGLYADTIPTAGCDSIIILNLTTTAPAYDSVSQSVCTGQTVTVGTHTYSSTGIYRDTFATANCDSIHVLNLQVGGYLQGNISQAICQGQSYNFNGQALTQPGVYYDTIASVSCDSIVTLTLSITAPAYDSVVQTVCVGGSITIGGHTYSTPGIYKDTFATANCDSIFVLNLQVGGYLHGAVSQSICQGQSFVFNGRVLTQPGIYYDTLMSVSCDSIVTLTLATRSPAYDSVVETICAGHSVIVGPHIYSASGIYTDIFATAGCDSVHVLNLTVSPIPSGTVTESICQGQSYTLGSHTYTQSGTYIDTVAAAGGCDSILTLQLTVLPTVNPSLTITVSHGPIINGMVIDTFTANYTNCPNPYYSWFEDIAPLGIHTAVAVVSFPVGTQDSILCRINCNDGCAAENIVFSNSIFTGINQLSFIQGVNVYPNPTQGIFNVDIDAPSITNKDAQISVIDMMGQTILAKPITLQSGYNKELISMGNAASGVYIVQLTVDGQSLYYRLVLDRQ